MKDNTYYPTVLKSGWLEICGSRIACAVLNDGSRVLQQGGTLETIGRAPRARAGLLVNKNPLFAGSAALKPFISRELEWSTRPLIFRGRKGGGNAGLHYGYHGEALPRICMVYVKALEAGKLHHKQKHIAHKAILILDALSAVGITALIDEATGYQKHRPGGALAQLFDTFLSAELREWVKTFPDDFYREIFRLKGWRYNAQSVRRPRIVGVITNDIIYDRFAPVVGAELKRTTPTRPDGQRVHTFHQRLTDSRGLPALQSHIHAVTGLMRAATTWRRFQRMLDKAFPKLNGGI